MECIKQPNEHLSKELENLDSRCSFVLLNIKCAYLSSSTRREIIRNTI